MFMVTKVYMCFKQNIYFFKKINILKELNHKNDDKYSLDSLQSRTHVEKNKRKEIQSSVNTCFQCCCYNLPEKLRFLAIGKHFPVMSARHIWKENNQRIGNQTSLTSECTHFNLKEAREL